MLHPPQPQDKSAAFTGLVIAGIALAAILYGMVHFTNQKYAGHAEGAPAAQGTAH